MIITIIIILKSSHGIFKLLKMKEKMINDHFFVLSSRGLTHSRAGRMLSGYFS